MPASICDKKTMSERVFWQNMGVFEEKSASCPTPGSVFHMQHFSFFCMRHAVLVGVLVGDLSGFRSSALRFVLRRTLFSVLREVNTNDMPRLWQLQWLCDRKDAVLRALFILNKVQGAST